MHRSSRARRAPWKAALLAVLIAGPAVPAVPVARAATKGPARGAFIVLFKDPATNARRAAADQARLGVVPTSFLERGLSGYVGTMTLDVARQLSRQPNVSTVALDTPVGVADTALVQDLRNHPAYTDLPPIWGLDRIDHQAGAPLADNLYHYSATGAGVTAYVIDTGVRTTHVEFGGRARGGYDIGRAASDPQFGQDCNGHGTHVAGTLGGATFGVAKKVSIVSVRVIDCTGSGLASDIVRGLDWVVGDHRAGLPAVANMSLGGSTNDALDAAVKAAVADGITVTVAAGNGGLLGFGQDACYSSPARVPEAVTMAATDSADRRAGYSNYGSCVDLYGPGSEVTSAYSDSDTAWKSLSGTSMAAPHAAGVAALVLTAMPSATPLQVSRILSNLGTGGVVTGSYTAGYKLLYSLWDDTPSQLVAAGAQDATPPPPPPSSGVGFLTGLGYLP